MAKRISIINFKGGVGKTTLAFNLAAGIARYHNPARVLVVDVALGMVRRDAAYLRSKSLLALQVLNEALNVEGASLSAPYAELQSILGTIT